MHGLSSYWNTLCFKVSFIRCLSKSLDKTSTGSHELHSPIYIPWKSIGDDCLSRRMKQGRYWCYIQYTISNSITVFTLWQYPVSVCGQSCCRVWGCGTEAGFWGDVWLHGILTNISWTRTVVEVLLCMHRLASTYSHLAHILASLTLCLALPCMKWTCLVLICVYSLCSCEAAVRNYW